jgi:hypothetical protein
VCACDLGHTVRTRAWARSIELREGDKRFYKVRGVNSSREKEMLYKKRSLRGCMTVIT